jgi:hypothetical protein
MIKSRHHGKLKTNTNVQAQIALILIIESHVNNEVATHSNKIKIRATQSLVQNSINSRIISLFVSFKIEVFCILILFKKTKIYNWFFVFFKQRVLNI